MGFRYLPITLILGLLTLCSPASAAWYNGDWLYRIPVTVQSSQVNGDLSNFPVYVDLNDLGSSFFSNVKGSGADIRVTKSDETTEVAIEVVEINTSAETGQLFFVANGTLSGSSNGEYYIYYGNNGATAYSASDTYGSQNVWMNSYTGVWHFEEDPSSSSPQLQDSTSSNKDGTTAGFMSSSDLVAGQIGNGYDLDGGDDYVDFGNNFSYSTGQAVTYSVWIKTTDGGGFIMGKPSFDFMNNPGTYLHVSGNKFRFRLVDSEMSGSILGETTSDSVQDGSWKYLVATYDASTSLGGMKSYIDGDEATIGSSEPGFGLTDLTHSNAFKIGVDAQSDALSGSFDEMRVATVERTGAWINTVYNNINSPSTFYSAGSEESSGGGSLTVSSFSPADNSTAIAITTNLDITFSEAVDIQTGNVTIKKLSDDTTVQTISVISGQVSGNGTTSISVNPSNLVATTSYYINIDNGAFKSLDGTKNYAGFTDNGTWNFTTVSSSCDQNADPSDWYDCDWQKRVKVTVDADMVNGDLSNFPVYLDLSNLPDEFFDNVANAGADIRVTKSDGTTEVAREVVYVDKTNNAGELHFVANGTLSGTSNSDWYLYYENSSASEPAEDATYGKEKVWDSNFDIVYHMHEDPSGSAPQILDSSSNDSDGTTEGTMTTGDSVSGLLGNAIDFDASDDGVDTNVAGINSFTWCAWVNPDAIPASYQTIISYSNSPKMLFSTYDNGLSLWSDDGLAGSTLSITTIDKSSWTQLCFVREGNSTSNGYKAYQNGALMGQANTITQTPASDIFIGKRESPAAQVFDGKIDEIRISDTNRTSAWINTEYNNIASASSFSSSSNETDRDSVNLLSLVPADNEVNVEADSNLVIYFDKTINVQTGNVTIKRLSNDSTVEAIDVTSGQVSGNGTAQITLNPSVNLSDGSYYIEVDASAFDDTAGNSYTGFTGNGTWNFTTLSSNPLFLFHD